MGLALVRCLQAGADMTTNRTADMFLRVTIHTGPKGGVEYRLHDDSKGTFRCVTKYVAAPYMSDEVRAQADAAESARKAARKNKAEDASAWARIMRGG